MKAFPFRRALAPMLVSAALAAAWAVPAVASSHREAPFIATQPQVDGTDFYMFRSYEPGRSGFVTLVANYLPLQDPYGGPNYFKLDPNAAYEIHVTNGGSAVENLTFQFKFQTTNDDNKFNVGGKMVSIPIVQNGSADVSTPNSPALNVHEKYTLSVIRGPRRSGAAQPVANLTQGGTSFDKPVDYIGTKTISNYVGYANKHIYDIQVPGCTGTGKVFVGQRKDPFVVNLGETFDLVNIKYPAVELNPLAEYATVDTLADKNVTSLILELPIACLTEGKGDIIGGWTTASVPASRVGECHAGQRTRSDDAVGRTRAGFAGGHAAGQRSRDRAQGQEQVQRQRTQGRRAVRRLRDQSDAADAPRSAVRLRGREGSDQLPAHRSRCGLPDRNSGREPASGRRGLGAGPAQHVDRGDADVGAEAALA